MVLLLLFYPISPLLNSIYLDGSAGNTVEIKYYCISASILLSACKNALNKEEGCIRYVLSNK